MANINLTRAFLPLHATARAIAGNRIFRDPADKVAYLRRFVSVARQELVAVHAYCLLDDELHFLLTARTDDAIPTLFKRVHTWWSQFLNSEMKRAGPVFGSTYHSCLLDKDHYWVSLRYIETAPLRRGGGLGLSTFQYSSAAQHLTACATPWFRSR